MTNGFNAPIKTISYDSSTPVRRSDTATSQFRRAGSSVEYGKSNGGSRSIVSESAVRRGHNIKTPPRNGARFIQTCFSE